MSSFQHYHNIKSELNFAACRLRLHEIRRRKSEGGQKFLPPNPLPFCPPERKLSKFSVRIFAEKSSDFVQETQQFKNGLSAVFRMGLKIYFVRGISIFSKFLVLERLFFQDYPKLSRLRQE